MEEVRVLANTLPDGYIDYSISPWVPLPWWPFERQTSLNPFKFEAIEARLVADGVDRIFLVGNFPRGRMVQVRASVTVGRSAGDFLVNPDAKCKKYFDAVTGPYSWPVRYFKALHNLLDDVGVTPMAAREIFPSLNLAIGCVTTTTIPNEIVAQLPDILHELADSSQRLSIERVRPSQAVIVDSGEIKQREREGTSDLIKAYQRRNDPKVCPYLIKIPSKDFGSALDEPTIGPQTIHDCRVAGIAGIVVCGERVRVIARAETIQAANNCGIFLYGLSLAELGGGLTF